MEEKDQSEIIQERGGDKAPKAAARRSIKSFVLRQARMTEAQSRALESYKSQYCLSLNTESSVPSLESLFSRKQELILEIGFGMGHATAEIALSRPQYNYLAAEVHSPGVGALLDRIVNQNINNLKIFHGDVQDLFKDYLPQASLSGIHVFFPDPWPKKKHWKRRLVQKAFLETLLPFCKPEAYLYMVSDWEAYALWMLDALKQVPQWHNPSKGFCEAQPWRPETSFERKGLAKNHKIYEILAYRKDFSDL